MSKVKVGLIQQRYRETREATAKWTLNSIKDLAKAGVKIICLQELFADPYFCNQYDEKNFDLALEKNSDFFKPFKEICQDYSIVLILPFFEKEQEGLYYNSVIVFGTEGEEIGFYRKIHVPDDPHFFEKFYFRPGNLGTPVIDTPWAKIGVLICWDQWFPEAARLIALKGAQILFYPTAIGILEGEEKNEETFIQAWTTVQRASGISNGLYICSVNRVGREKDHEFWGHSFISGPMGELTVPSLKKEEASIQGELDLELISKVKRTWPFLRDRRPECYKDISKP